MKSGPQAKNQGDETRRENAPCAAGVGLRPPIDGSGRRAVAEDGEETHRIIKMC